MSTFRLKNDKPKYVTEIKTLDETHKKIVTEFQKRKRLLPRKKNQLIELAKKLQTIEAKDASQYTNEDIKFRSKLKSDMVVLTEEIYDIENNISETEYYSKTNELLMDYYDILEEDDWDDPVEHSDTTSVDPDTTLETNQQEGRTNQDNQDHQDHQDHQADKLDTLDKLNILNRQNKKPKKITRRRKKRINDTLNIDIMSYFSNIDSPLNSLQTNKEQNQKQDESEKDKKDRSELLDKFRMLVDNEYLCEKNKNKGFIRKCEECNTEKTLNQAEGSYVCQRCGISEMIIIESETPNYKDSIPDKPGYPYKRINHFNEWLSQFQAKESTEIPREIYDMILAELHKQKMYDLKKLNLASMKRVLKKLGITQQYEHTTHIISKLSGLPPPTINRETEEELRRMFKIIQEPFEKHRPKTRLNFLSYSYVLHKFCQLLELDEFVRCFPLLKSREKLRQQDKIWEAMCEELRWEYIPSI
jgi:hypothetical protein